MVDQATLAKIHIAKKELAMDDDTYRALLMRVAEVSSSKDLTAASASKVLAEFARLGWKPKAKKAVTRPPEDSAQLKMIRGLWIELHQMGKVEDPSESALAAWCKRMMRVDAPQWLTKAQASKLIEALKKWRDRPSENG